MIKIRSMTQGFRRSGVSFSKEFSTFQDDHFTPEELAGLKAEPMLEVQHVEAELEMEQADPDDETTAREVLGNMTNDKLKADCDAMGIAYPANATKGQLVNLIMAHTAPVPEG